jgi:hypothetical protein
MNKTLVIAALAAVIGSAVTIGIIRFGEHPAPASPEASNAKPAVPALQQPAEVTAETAAEPAVQPEAKRVEPRPAPPAAPPTPRTGRTQPVKASAPKPAQPVAPRPAAAPVPATPETPTHTSPAAIAETRPNVYPPAPTPAPRVPRKVTIPVGTLVTVRIQQHLSSDTNLAGDAFPADLAEPLVVGDMVIAEKGARLDGRVVSADKGGRVKGLSEISIHLVTLHTSDGQNVAISTDTFGKAGEKSTREDAVKVGVGSAIGAAIGAIAGGGKGAAIGAAAGGGAGTGAVLATRGKPAEIESEARIAFRINKPVTLTEKLP